MGYGEMLPYRNIWLCMLMAIFMVVIVSAPGHLPVTTHLFVAGSLSS
jgi:hypothetical protein